MESLYERLKRGEAVHVISPIDGQPFTIQPVAWMGVYAYTVLVDGKPVKGHTGLILDNFTLASWCQGLVEQTLP